MPDRTSALYASKGAADWVRSSDWRALVLDRVEQLSGLDVRATMARDTVLYLVEGDAAAVAAFLHLLSNGQDDPDARALIGSAMARWDARPGRLMTPILTEDEKAWLAARLNCLGRHAREIQACLRWANMRTRETAFFDFGGVQASANDSFPACIFIPLGNAVAAVSPSLDFTSE